MNKLLANLKDKQNRKARFKTVIALTFPVGHQFFTGICEGDITKEKKGEDGFGYDPIFQPKSFDKTFAEMTQKQKGEIGHRGKAVRMLIEFLS